MLSLPVLQRRFILLYFLIFIFNSHAAFSNDAIVSWTDTHVFRSDTVLIDATVLEDDSNYYNEGTLSTGFSMMNSAYLSALYIPVKYAMTDNFYLSFSLPFLTKTIVDNGSHYSKSGYGDIMLGLTGSFKPFRYLSSSTTARVTLPTGNVNAQDNGYLIPLGNGGFTASLQESFSIGGFDAGFITIRLFVSGIGVYYLQSTAEIDALTKYSYKPSYMWSGIGGLDLGLTENLSIEFKAGYISIKERKYKIETDPPVAGDAVAAGDSVKQINLLPFIKYRFTQDVTGQAGAVYPLKTTLDKQITEKYDPEWKYVMSIEKRFVSSISSDNGVKEKVQTNKYSEKYAGKYSEKYAGIEKEAVEENSQDAVEEEAAAVTNDSEKKVQKKTAKRKKKKRRR